MPFDDLEKNNILKKVYRTNIQHIIIDHKTNDKVGFYSIEDEEFVNYLNVPKVRWDDYYDDTSLIIDESEKQEIRRIAIRAILDK